jgi:hypothetical protein
MLIDHWIDKVASSCPAVMKGMEIVHLGKFAVIVHEVKERATNFLQVTFYHERRASNIEAHGLASMSVYQKFVCRV